MKKFLFHWLSLMMFLLALAPALSAQDEQTIQNRVQAAITANYQSVAWYFDQAYLACPSVPRGMLEAVSFTNTRFRNINPATDAPSCTGMPMARGPMGLISDGQGYFRNNASLVAQQSGMPLNQVLDDPAVNIMAFARAWESLAAQMQISSARPEDHVPVLVALSELPDGSVMQNYALASHLYSVLRFLETPAYSGLCGFNTYTVDFTGVFGEENYQVLKSSWVVAGSEQVKDKKGRTFRKRDLLGRSPKSADYPPALWDLACTDNFSSRNGTAITTIALHTVQGSYAGCISWFNNCSAHVSTHYVMRSSDGQVTQMVLEADKAWHVGTHNPYTIGWEHEGWVSDPSWYTVAMYASSADLTKDICNSGYGINPKRCFWGPATSGIYVVNCPKIKGHQNFSDQTHTDPGINWDWNYYYKLVNSARVPVNYTASTGSFYDTGGSGGNYSDNEGELWLIQPAGASSVTLTFSAFSVEANWDYMYIYDGNTVFSPVIGVYTGTNSPGTVTATSGAMLIEFRSDCSTVGTGWAASWTSNTGTTNPTGLQVSQAACPSNDITFSWTNSGTGWYIALSTDPTFATYDWKWVSGLTSYTGLAGFVDHVDGTPATFQPGTTYYWYMRANGANHAGPSFTTHTCSSPVPTNMQVTAPSCANQTASFTWTNSGANWVLDVSVDSTFTSKSSKAIPSMTSTSGPSGFSPAFFFHHNTRYYWRIFNGSVYTSGPSFLSPMCDTTAPTTAIVTAGNWQTQDFNVDFTDEDDSLGTGVEKGYYQVIDYDGSEWHANSQQGFFADNYDLVIGAEYTIPSWGGNWSINSGNLRQSNADSSNTNIYAPLTQNLSNRYLYNFRYRLNTASGNRRFGFHFFSDDGSATNRGNSYFIWFRANSISTNYTLEFYKCSWSGGINVFTLEYTINNVMTNAGQWYDVIVIYDRITGEMNVYRDNEWLGSWTDPAPISTGSYISFRTGNADVSFDELKIYRSRYPNVTVTVGNDVSNMARFQNPDPATFACKVKSIAEDFAGNLSAIAYHNINIDWTPPSSCSPVNDGSGPDVDTIFTHQLSANWSLSSDVNSGLDHYEYAVGTSPGDSNTIGWTSSGLSNSVSFSHSLVSGQIYYFSVRAVNGAGLLSSTAVSDGQLYLDVTAIYESEGSDIAKIFPNPVSGMATVSWYSEQPGTAMACLSDICGRTINQLNGIEVQQGENILMLDFSGYASGAYVFRLQNAEQCILIPITVFNR